MHVCNLQNDEQRRSACREADYRKCSMGKKEGRKRKAAKNHSMGYCHKQYSRYWLPGASSSRETRVPRKNEGELRPCTSSVLYIVHTASQAVRSGEHIEKKKRGPCRMPKALHNRDGTKNIYIIGGHRGQVKNKFTVITGRFLATETKYSPSFSHPPKKLTRMHTAQHHCPQVH